MSKNITPPMAKLSLFTLAFLVFLLSSCDSYYRNCGPNKGLLVTSLKLQSDGLCQYRVERNDKDYIVMDFIDSAYKYKLNDTIYLSKNR
jgi:hypothetical protein